MRKFILPLVFLLVAPLASAQTVVEGSSTILTLHDYTRPPVPRLPSKFEILVWNIQKAGNPQMVSDFQKLAAGSELVLFQEAVDTAAWVPQLIRAKPDLGWKMAQSFRSNWNGYSTGVATGSRVIPLKIKAALSPNQEPISFTPKSILASEYELESSAQTLLVANIHAINFREQDAFESHIHQLVALIRDHQGPLIVAGDFNTWNPIRASFLTTSLEALGLREVPLQRSGFLILDHVFVRGLRAREVAPHFDIQSSDHYPISVEVEI